LLAALVDNEIFHGSRLDVNPARISWKRVLDVNDRALRHVVIGLGGSSQGVPRETGFDITAASEVMAVLTLSRDVKELRHRLSQMIIASGPSGYITVDDLKAQDALTAVLNDAMMPNLVQTSEHTPVIMHGGPFANIAHGCNSIVATEAGLRLSDVVITEAGFGADLGAEKFLDIKAPVANLEPQLAVVVVTLRALRYHGGQPLAVSSTPNQKALEAGIENLWKHIENLQSYGLPVIVGINRFRDDTDQEIQWLTGQLGNRGISAAAANIFAEGGQGGIALGQLVQNTLSTKNSNYKPLYEESLSLRDKIHRIATRIYGAGDVEYSPAAHNVLKRLNKWNQEQLRVCIAKTQYSLSENPALLGRPEGFVLHVRDIEVARGAGYIVPLAGDMIRMPGLPKDPAAFRVTVDNQGEIHGIK
jgi:formate--tetrahydrofolate ligase